MKRGLVRAAMARARATRCAVDRPRGQHGVKEKARLAVGLSL
jgi:hypothetical protein